MTLPAEGLFAIDRIEAQVSPFAWDFPRERAAEIAAVWEREMAGKPHIYNGRVLLQHAARVEDGVFHARYFETHYREFLGWLRLGYPGPTLRNGFAMAALRADDGAYLLGEMAAHTVNAGRVYFAAGTPDLSDVAPDGSVDLAGSVLREMAEETGLTAAEVTVGQGWTAVLEPGRVAFMRPVSVPLPAREARELMLERMKSLPEQELSDIVIIRAPADIAPLSTRMPVFMQRYLTHMLG